MKYRETPCEYYECLGSCTKDRDASHSGYCQHCNKYKPRVKERHLNMKKQKLQKIREKEGYYE